MKRAIALVLVLLFVGTAAQAATLNYAIGSYWGWENWNTQDVRITAKDGLNDIWSMDIIVPTAGNTNSSHSIGTPGIVCGFRDLQHGGAAYEYSPKWALGGDVWSGGMMRFANIVNWGNAAGAVFTYDTTHNNYFEYRWTTTGLVHLGSATDPTNTVDTVLTVRINAPTVGGGGFATDISASFTMTNNQASALDTWYIADSAGFMDLGLIGGGGAFVNPDSATAKPIVHGAGEHPLYQVTDWYGSKVTTIDGALIQAVVKDNADTLSRNMRAGLIFKLEAPTMAMYYSDLANNMYGSTVQNTGVDKYFITGNIAQPGPLGQILINPGQTLGIDYTGFIGIPEPATMSLLGLGLIGLVLRRKK